MINETISSVDDEVSIKLSASALESLRAKRIQRTGVRVYNDGCIGVSGYMGTEGDAEARKRAAAALDYKIPYPGRPSTGQRRAETVGSRPFTPAALDAEAAALLAAFRKEFPQFVYSSSGIKTGTSQRTMRNDAGLDYASSITTHEFTFFYKLASSSSILDGWFSYTGTEYDRAAFQAYGSEMLAAHLREVPLPAEGRLPVFFEENDSQIRNIFFRELAGMTFGSGSSLFSGKVGQRLFNEGFTLYNSPSQAFRPFFDAEGVCGEGFKYIENGILRAPYADKKTAAKFGYEPSGTAVAAYDGTPEAGAGNMRIQSQARTFKEMLGGQPAIFVSMAMGGDYTSKGGYGTPAQVAFLVKDGKLAGRLPELQLSSGVYEMFGRDFLGVSSDPVMPLSSNRWLGCMMDVRKN